MDYRQMTLCAAMVLALLTAVTVSAPLNLWEIAALDDILDDAYEEALAELESNNVGKRSSSWTYCRHHVTGSLCKCSSRLGMSSSRYFECEVPPYLNNPWNRITRNW
ncbi:uncharacterized protein [Diadema antillarum]|uniref:uncharacterized protein n=1 Tax=Diadema antillarum TaxID=105358 RepID=UPI003A83FD9D